MGKDNVANCDQEPRATVAPSDQSEAGLTVSGLNPDEAADLVKARERSGHDASTMHIEGDELAPGTGASARNDPIASNDHANLVSVGRPAALAALIGGLAHRWARPRRSVGRGRAVGWGGGQRRCPGWLGRCHRRTSGGRTGRHVQRRRLDILPDLTDGDS